MKLVAAIPDERMQQIISLFQHVGYKSPSMLDIAHQLSISTKTLYSYTNNKEDLIVMTIRQIEQRYHKKCEECLDKTSERNELQALFTLFADLFEDFPYHAVQDLSQHYPTAYNEYISVKTQCEEALTVHIQLAQGNKRYQNELDADFLSKLISFQIEQISHQRFMHLKQSKAALLEAYFEFTWGGFIC